MNDIETINECVDRSGSFEPVSTGVVGWLAPWQNRLLFLESNAGCPLLHYIDI